MCGLKHGCTSESARQDGSHPSWVCGLKQGGTDGFGGRVESHPSWVCGLKHNGRHQGLGEERVTPFVGVWIETRVLRGIVEPRDVTPFVGVWIETENTARQYETSLSHPSWVCGLKHVNIFISEISAFGHTLRGCVD